MRWANQNDYRFKEDWRRQIDGVPLGGQRDGHRGKRAAHPITGLKHGFIGQTPANRR